MQAPMNTRCYAARRLNPFLGVVQVLETGTARAISVDSLNWQIQVKARQQPGLRVEYDQTILSSPHISLVYLVTNPVTFRARLCCQSKARCAVNGPEFRGGLGTPCKQSGFSPV